MRRSFAIPVLIALFSFGWGASSQAEVEQKDNLRVTFDADFAPHRLPRDRSAPVTVEIEGKIETIDGTHPPSLRWLEIDLHRSGRIFSAGLPTCSAPSLQSTSTRDAIERCGRSRIGGGSFSATVKLGKDIPTTGQIIAFNSRKGGRQSVLLHLFADAPVRFTLVVPLTIGHRQDGQFGTVLRAKIPRLGGDLGSITAIQLKIGRRYSYRGKRRSYASAACGAPDPLHGGPFPFARANLRFEEHPKIQMTLVRYCSVRRG